jgi:hypothetical protein
LAYLKTANAYCYLIFATHSVVNLNCGREIYITSIVTPLTQLMNQGVTQNVRCYCWSDFLSQTCESRRNTKSLINALMFLSEWREFPSAPCLEGKET